MGNSDHENQLFINKRDYTFEMMELPGSDKTTNDVAIGDIDGNGCPPTTSPAPSTSPSIYPTRNPWCDSDKTSIYITINKDTSRATNWQLKNLESDSVVADGSGYDPSSTENISLCAQGLMCYSFTNSKHFTYLYTLEVDHVLIASGNKLGMKVKQQFLVARQLFHQRLAYIHPRPQAVHHVEVMRWKSS